MNILIYTHYYPAPDSFGMEKDTHVIRYFAEKLKEKGHQVRVVRLYYRPVKELTLRGLSYLKPAVDDYEYNGIPVHLIRYQMLTPRRFFPEEPQARFINENLRKWKRETGFVPDKVFVHFPTNFVGVTEIFADTKAVMGDFHNLDVTHMESEKFGTQVREFIARFPALGYRNKRVLEYLSARFSSAPVRVYTGIEAGLLAAPEMIAGKKDDPGDPLRLIYVGQLIPLKNVDVLIRAFRRLPFPAELTVVGDGPLMPALKELAAGEGRIRFTGWLEREEVLKTIDDANALVMVSSPESYGMVYLEAMARGVIPIASLGEGFDGIITDRENGFLLPPGDEEALLERLTELRHMGRDERAALIGRAYETACGLTEDLTTDLFLRENRG